MVDFYGYATRSLSNPFFSLDVLTTAGPRIVRLVPIGTEVNLLAEVPSITFPTPHGPFYPLGGHRLWAGPEIPAITYLPDHLSAELEEIPSGLRILHEDHVQPTHYQRQLEIIVDPDAPKVKLVHQIKNLGEEPLNILPWAVTQFRLGSKAHLPMDNSPYTENSFLPNRNVVLWPYTDLHDPRFHLENHSIEIDAIASPDALKVGIYCPAGWAAIEFTEGWVLVKRFSVLPPAAHSDLNTNLQCYVRDAFIELETLGKLSSLGSGEAVTHIEEWELHRGKLADLHLD